MRNGERVLYEFNDYRLDPSERQLTLDGRTVPLPPRTFDTLVALVKRKGHRVEKNQLLDEVWSDSFIEEVNLTVRISALRRALGENKSGPLFIETVPKRGYRFVAPVTEFADDEVLVAQSFRISAVNEEIETNGSAAPQASTRLIKRRNALLSKTGMAVAVAIIAVVAAAVAIFSIMRFRVHSPPNFAGYSWRKLSSDERNGAAIIAPDGEFIIFAVKGEHGVSIKMQRLGSDEAVTIVPSFDVPSWGPAISHDRHYFYYVLG